MSGREWNPGDVAAVLGADDTYYLGTYHEGDCLLGCAAGSRDAGHWHAGGGAMSAATYDARTLVVIDPEDREQVERLLTSLQDMSFAAHACGAFTCLQTALREFANPTPPKPDEPTGLGAVVEDAEGVRWIRVDWSNPWCRANPSNRQDGRTLHGSHLNWAQVDAVCVLSEGVQP